MSRFTKGLMAVAGMSLCVSTAAVANDLTVVSWGGAYTKSLLDRTAFFCLEKHDRIQDRVDVRHQINELHQKTYSVLFL